MPPPEGTVAGSMTLVDAVDHALNRGVVLVGETTLSVAGVDLVYLGLNLVLASVETLRESTSGAPHLTGLNAPSPLPAGDRAPVKPGRKAMPVNLPTAASPNRPEPLVLPELRGLPERVPADGGENPARGLARLVLTLVEALRQILERQAVRRMEGGSLSDTEVEQMGLALMELEAKLAELRDVFGLEPGDLNVDLGPLGRLL